MYFSDNLICSVKDAPVRVFMLWVAILSFLGVSGVAQADELFSVVSVPQASGYSEAAMTIEDTMAAANQLAAVLPKVASNRGNSSAVLQFGSYNSAQVSQAGVRNVGLIAQYGQFNNAAIAQSGSNNQAVVLQRGTGNIAMVTQR
jgi:hypothetical protein